MHWFWQDQTLASMFHLALPVGEKILRPVVVYAFLVVALRIFGKRELTNINPFDFVVLLSLSNTVQNAIIGDDNSVSGGLIGAFTLLAINYLTVRCVFKRKRLDQILEGSPTVLVEDGKVIGRALDREMLSEAELTTVAHRQGFASLHEVQRCVLEPGGNFYVQGKEPGPDQKRHDEMLQMLRDLSGQVAALKPKAA